MMEDIGGGDAAVRLIKLEPIGASNGLMATTVCDKLGYGKSGKQKNLKKRKKIGTKAKYTFLRDRGVMPLSHRSKRLKENDLTNKNIVKISPNQDIQLVCVESVNNGEVLDTITETPLEVDECDNNQTLESTEIPRDITTDIHQRTTELCVIHENENVRPDRERSSMTDLNSNLPELVDNDNDDVQQSNVNYKNEKLLARGRQLSKKLLKKGISHDSFYTKSSIETANSSKWSSIRYAMRMANMNKRNEPNDTFMEKFNINRRSTPPNDLSRHNSSESTHSEPNNLIKMQSNHCTKRICFMCIFNKLVPINPEGSFMFWWLFVVVIAVCYNLWTLIARQAFKPLQTQFAALWYTCDSLADLIYLLDIVVQSITSYLEHGLSVTRWQKLVKNYVCSRYMIMDILAILPLDLLYLAFGTQPLLRFPRFIKAYRLFQFNEKAENLAPFPNVLRVCSLTHVLLLLCHWFAGFYFMISKVDGLVESWASNDNTTELNETTRQYLTSLYWGTLTLTTIGDVPSPTSNWEYVFQILSFVIGVFVFSTIVGQVANAISSYNQPRHEYETLLDGVKLYMRSHDVPHEMQVRVQRWCNYAWSRGRFQGALDINSLKMLPDRLKTELALHVHLDILKKVCIFDDCEPEFLHDLVLKMETYIYTPSDLVVRKGEIAREMFIIADGHLEVIGDKGRIIASLSTGNFFGEIGILNLDGGINRRTADVRSVGYSELFVLKRKDVVRAIKYYPSAKASLMRHARNRLEEMRKQNNLVPDLQVTVSQPTSANETDTEDESDQPYHKQSSPSLDERRRKSLHKISSLSSDSIDNDHLRICENELITRLSEEIKRKDKLILRLTEELYQQVRHETDTKSGEDQ